jgi:hypothetical protein
VRLTSIGGGSDQEIGIGNQGWRPAINQGFALIANKAKSACTLVGLSNFSAHPSVLTGIRLTRCFVFRRIGKFGFAVQEGFAIHPAKSGWAIAEKIISGVVDANSAVEAGVL